MASSLFQRPQNEPPADDGGLLGRFQAFAKEITPQEAEKRLNALLSSGQMSRNQFNALANQAKQLMKLFGLK